MSKKEEYVDRIKAILDEAARDSELEVSGYEEVLDEIATECNDRSDALEVDIEDEDGDVPGTGEDE